MKASALPLILILVAAFGLIISTMADFVTLEIRVEKRSVASQKAFGIAEAGLEYYRWRLAHFPQDFQDGAGGPGPYIHPYYDPQGGQTGQFSLAITPHNSCGEAQWVDISSTGQTVDFPTVKRVLNSRYARSFIARYAFITNENVWLGTTEIARGLFHSNKGVRMDGFNDSLVTSALSTWNCTSSFGCSPTQSKPGVFGSGPGGTQGLWKFPVQLIDFTLVTSDLVRIKSAAQTSGIYIPRPIDIGYPTAKGYHIIFNNNGTVTVNIVKTTQFVNAYSPETRSWYRSYEVINQEVFYNTYTLPPSCSAMFLEGDVWMEGEVNGKMTIASANLVDPNVDTSIILNSSIIYTSASSSGLTAIAERNIRIRLYSPDTITLNGIFIAQKGFFGRDYYGNGHTPWHIREKLIVKGTIVSNLQSVTNWIDGNGNTVSGYKIEDNSYDPLLATDPPPLTPFTDDEYKFVKWEEL